jgi:alpha-methylacyl-CoA racemase
MIERAEILYEGFRPGVMEQLGLGPEPVLQRNPSLVYGRITGWGQTGPLAHAAGHDINYVALSGALGSLGTKDKPFPPLNLLGDMGGGGMSAAIGLLAALTHARATGKGQVVDCAITEAASTLMAMFYGMYAKGRFNLERGTNMGDGASHFYNTYECSDGKWISVGSIEPVFYETLVELTGFQPVAKQWDRSSWPEMRAAFGDLFLTRSRNEWCRLLEGTDACFAPVLDLSEAPEHPHCLARESYVTLDGVTQPAPMPRFSHTPALIQGCPPVPGSDYSSVMEDWNL